MAIKLQEVIHTALRDESFAMNLRRLAENALGQEDPGAAEWNSFLSQFPMKPEELQAMQTPVRGPGGETPGIPTVPKMMANAVISTVNCTLTTTTTTGSLACEELKLPRIKRAASKGGSSKKSGK